MPPLKDWIQNISFLTSASKTAELPADGPGEIAIAGRSNAGKSSAMNLICNRRRLAFSSKTPGRTQLINVFTLHHHEQEVGRLVDLPGYGYAAVSQAIKARWQRELATFLETRASLVGLILVMDIRHPFGPLDRQMLQWFDRRNRPIHVLLTKADKLTRNEQAIALAQARRLNCTMVAPAICPARAESCKKKPGEVIAGRERLNGLGTRSGRRSGRRQVACVHDMSKTENFPIITTQDKWK
jgi:GTP-binding protein